MDDDIKVTHTRKESGDDPYRRLMLQLVREEELDGIAIITFRTEKDRMIFNSRSHGGAVPGSGSMAEMLTQIASEAMIEAMKTLVMHLRHKPEEDGHHGN